jgi:hypothetical protein
MSKPLPSEYWSVQQRAYVTYTFAGTPSTDSSTITLLESRSVISASGTTGFRTWEASIHLASFLFSQQGSVYIENKRILELGAGTGLVAIFCARYLKTKYVLASDGSQDVVDALQDNVFLNGLDHDSHIDCRILRWGRSLDEDEDGQEKIFDVLLGADIVGYKFFLPSQKSSMLIIMEMYDESQFPLLLSSLRICFASNRELLVLISAIVRNKIAFTNFITACSTSSLAN